MTEQWKPIKEYEGYYSVSNLGRVRSEARTVVQSNGVKYPVKEKLLKLNKDTKGYNTVVLYMIGERKHYPVHRLVAMTFIDNPGNHPMVLHGPNGKTDNSVGNLYWGNARQNSLDKQRDGTCQWTNKTHCPQQHEYSEKNTLFEGNGKRRCRSCRRADAYLRRRPDSVETLQQVSDRYYLNQQLIQRSVGQ